MLLLWFKWTVEHLFFYLVLLFRMVYFTYSIPPPMNITNMFENWWVGVNIKDKARIHIGISVLCWSIWTTRNGIVFLYVIIRADHRYLSLMLVYMDNQKWYYFSAGYYSSCPLVITLSLTSSGSIYLPRITMRLIGLALPMLYLK
jgi:hypothetical protein